MTKTAQERHFDYDRIVVGQQKVDNATDQFLRDSGWRHRCDTPGSHWMWCKVISSGETIMVNRDSAFHFELILLGLELNGG